jgi:hypothetical protein
VDLGLDWSSVATGVVVGPIAPIRRTIFALGRAFWDALAAVGDHLLFAALSVVTLAVLTLVFVSRGDGLSALWGLGAVWLVFLVFVAFKFVQAWMHPDQHPDWEWEDYGVPPDLWKLDLRSFAPLRPRPSRGRVTPLLCRVLAPDNSPWESFGPTLGGLAPGDACLRWYPQDFKCPKCGQPPPEIPAGEYEITWLEPWRGPFRRPLLRYTQTAPEREQAPEPGGQAS